jgi:integrase
MDGGHDDIVLKEVKVFDAEGINEFLEFIRDSEYYPLFYLYLYTGARRGELPALRWSDCDLVMGYISINRTLLHLEDGSIVFRPPKTANSRRPIALPTSASIVLRQHKERQQAIKEQLGVTLQDEDLVFAHPDGSPLLPHSVSHAWSKLVKRAGFEGIRLHDARHSHASLMLA